VECRLLAALLRRIPQGEDLGFVSARPGATVIELVLIKLNWHKLQAYTIITCNPGLGQGFRASDLEFIGQTKTQKISFVWLRFI
jgi:hypothetical protein